MNKVVKFFLLTAGALGIGELIRKAANLPPVKYSYDWINQLSEVDWEKEREIVRLNYCNPQLDVPTKINWKRILDLFDRVKSDRNSTGDRFVGPAIHRENGWHLPNDD